ncbi:MULTISPECIES: tellurite resistance TerB family protein [Pseudomonas]|jgi:uncharacterized membrane protein YebE (DUF533 family)|uniref:tellurite resistance TerB family protein n=1 Tax=Pseudomonas TaxID=286 RepID=UPI000C3D20B4|nr:MULTISPECIES: tellurite resistance TerB family protein [unclassified Pseudomonas]MAB99626.1 hypothetical protein [Pseudomonadaceae bacterium]NRH28851.1 tellurite resistance TerB family protein [Pseudomonas sp. MS19]
MNTSDLLEQLLKSGLSGQGGGGRQSTSGMGGLGGALGGALGGLLGGGGQSSGASGGMGGLGGLLGGLLGGGQSSAAPTQAGGRQQGSGGGINYSGLATLGMLAFQAYSAWQRNQDSGAQTATRNAFVNAPQSEELLAGPSAGPELEERSNAVLRALIAASKADGRIDEQEKKLIYAEIHKLADDPGLQAWLDAEVRRPLNPADVAIAAKTPEMAAEMYLASALLVGRQEGGERVYLDQLAQHLGIEPGLQAHLEEQINA